MQVRITNALRGALLPAVAALGLLVALPAIQAKADQQQTTAQLDDAQNWGAGTSGAFAQAVHPVVRGVRLR